MTEKKVAFADMKMGHAYRVTHEDDVGSIGVYVPMESPRGRWSAPGHLVPCYRTGRENDEVHLYSDSVREVHHLGKAFYVEVDGHPIIVWDGCLYAGCQRFSPAKADKLVMGVAKALGWEMVEE